MNNINSAVQTYLKEFGGDGHSMIDPAALVRMGFEQDMVDRYTHVERSGKGKYQLYDNNGKPVKEIKGVYSLTFLYGIAETLKADATMARRMTGRGFQAQELCKAIKAVLDSNQKSDKKEEPIEVPAT